MDELDYQTRLSLVIPLRNEEENIKPLYDKLNQILQPGGREYEIIFVDDGSTDNSLSLLEELALSDTKVKVIQLQKHYGKSAALDAGFRESTGEVIITLDADLQEDPTHIPDFLAKLHEGYDLVIGWRYRRKDPFFKRISSRIFNKVTSRLMKIRLHDLNCGFKAMRRDTLNNLYLYPELHRFIPVLIASQGYKVTEVKINHTYRRRGRSKYGMGRYLAALLSFFPVFFIKNYSEKPFFFFGGLGLIFLFLGFLFSSYLGFLWFGGYRIAHHPALLLGLLAIIISIQLISLGLIGEFILRKDKRKQPYYLIKRKIGIR
jgi:glycosyltransferase involved in cell wall biosynthesis